MNSPIQQFKNGQDVAQTDIAQMPAIAMGFGSAQGFELMQRGAKLLASSSLVPKEYQNNISNCVIALNMANRLGADPLMVMQNLYLVHGRPGWSAKFLIATFNQCGRFTSVRYEKKGIEGAMDFGVRAWSTELSTGERIEGPWITWKLVNNEGWNKKSGSKWLTIPDKMFMYRAAAWMIDTHAPELSMGISTTDEIHDRFDEAKDIGGGTSAGAAAMRDKIEKLGIANPVIESNGETIDTKTGEVLKSEAIVSAEADQKRVAKFSEVSASLQSAKNLDELNEAYDLAREVKNPVHREQLDALYQQRETELK